MVIFAAVIKRAAILLFSIYLLSTPQLIELIKLPILVEHFVEHKEKNPTISFLEFLCIHYAHEDVQDADYDKDMKLPFKTMCTNTISFVAIIGDFSTFTQHILFTTSTNIKACYKPFKYASHYLSIIWQPPRVA